MADNSEYKTVTKKLEQLLKDAADVKEKATTRDEEIDTFYGNLIKEVFKFRQDVNDRLDELQREIVAEADTKKTIDKQIVRTVLGTCTSVSSDATKLLSSMKNKSAKQTDQFNDSIKEAKSILKSNTIKNTAELLEKTDKQYIFECNPDLKETLSVPHIFGKLNLHSLVVIPKKRKVFDKVDQLEDINVKTKSDKADCDIKGCEVICANKIVLADWGNKKVKILDSERNIIVDEKELEALPSDVAVLLPDKIAVTIPGKRVVHIMSTSEKLSTVQKIPIRGECTGIAYHNNYLYVICRSPKFIYVIDTQGDVQNTITLDSDLFSDPSNIVISEDSSLIFLNDFDGNCVASVTVQGETTAIYKQKDFAKPRGMLMLDDGSLLVCCWNGTIHHLQKDLKQGQKITGGMKHLRSICYNIDQNVYYIGSWTNLLRVLKA